MTVELWALHIKGPDDIIPMASKRMAEFEVQGWAGIAEVVKWPHSAESHAAALATAPGSAAPQSADDKTNG